MKILKNKTKIFKMSELIFILKFYRKITEEQHYYYIIILTKFIL